MVSAMKNYGVSQYGRGSYSMHLASHLDKLQVLFAVCLFAGFGQK